MSRYATLREGGAGDAQTYRKMLLRRRRLRGRRRIPLRGELLVRDGAYVHIPMGTLVDEPPIRPNARIFVGSKAKWFTITDDLPQYDEQVPG